MKRVLGFFSKFRNTAKKEIYKSPQEIRGVPWVRIQGDKTLRLCYDLNLDSVVFDLGGYEGQWASDIFGKYCCTIHIFEPMPQFAENIKKRFAKNPKIIVHQFGLASESNKAKISQSQDTSSILIIDNNSVDIMLIKAIDFLKENKISHIDLMKMNIEGSEYDLLEHLIDTNYITKIKNIQVQFHDFVPNAEKRMKEIQQKLATTHKLTYQYKFVWENWKIMDK
jgi:FkbM family methyltransferase